MHFDYTVALSTMTKISIHLSDQIRAFRRKGKSTEDISKILLDLGITVTDSAIRKHYRQMPVLRRTRKPRKMNSFDPMKKRMAPKKAAMIDGGPAQYHSAQLMKLHMEQIQTLKTDIESLKVDQQKETYSLRAEIRATADALVQSQVALTECQAALVESQTENGSLKRAKEEMMESQFMPIHVSSGTPLPTGSSSVHPDISIPPLTPERNELLTEHSMGRPDRYAVVLFQECVTKERYREWAQNTNWDGSRGKFGLPVNLRVFIMKNVSQMFLSLSDATRKSIKDRVNEYLRKPRKSGYGMARFP
ncbi:uncharacterized protein LOC112228217 isoform X3 [Oncorhynchus tshawytscha]|uniref:uncharacterized protein LOC112228217 isoform X3 n=1 Tax=Oncorhynchus tshawytscha TaxID=74940 RepID=UPI001C3DED75|nr:uncharacterized protein LOC112228217 isoform X3 [Oncorhynchus tshawytscha]